MPTFAIFDCETTGFTALDRVIEIAVVVLDGRSLATVDEFDTLVNPMRDVGRSDIHGIRPAMLAATPAFEEIIAGLAQRLDGAILVGHNLPFDQRFLVDECERASTPFDPGAGVCTYSLTQEKLASAAARHGIPLDGHHRALVDARATAELLRRVFEHGDTHGVPARMPRPTHASAARTLRREATGAPSTAPLRRILARACYPSSLEACVAYFDMLDWVLADGIISPEERRLLDTQVGKLGLTPAQVLGMHEAYFHSILCAVERDQHVSRDEQALLGSVARALGLDGVSIPAVTQVKPTPTAAGGGIQGGTRVCFTGTALDADGREIVRSELERLAASRGLQPVDDVTKKKCDLLVAADPESASGKAQKARKFGVPVISVGEFLSEMR